MVEPQIVDLVVEGSSPFFHPEEKTITLWWFFYAFRIFF